MAYTLVNIGKIAKVKSGYPFKSKDWQYQGVPVVKIANLKDGKLDMDGCSFVTEEVAQQAERFRLNRGDILVSMTGYIGEIALVRTNDHILLNQRVGRFEFVSGDIDKQFFFYALKLPSVKEAMQSHAYGAAQPNISSTLIENLLIPFPETPLQNRIGSILGAFDDLIENNSKRIKILEDMARLIYREWFVHYRFPNHENVKMVDSGTELGEVPEGWQHKTISDVADVFRGRAYKGSELADEGGLPFLNLKCFVRDGGFREDGVKRYTGDYKPHHTAKTGDIIMAVTDMTQERRVVARAARVPELEEPLFVFSMDAVKSEPKADVSKEYLYSMFQFSEFADAVKQHANGANVLHLNPASIEEHIFLCPSEDMMLSFAKIVSPIFKLSDCLSLTNSKLRQARDLLLPKIISGQLVVS